MDKPTIDLDNLLLKLQLVHARKSQRPDTYPDVERMDNLNTIAKLSMIIEAFNSVHAATNE